MSKFISDAIGYWEPRRIAYNGILLAVLLATRFLSPGATTQTSSFQMLQQLFLLAVLANVAYCAAYPLDLFFQYSDFRETWRRMRWMLLLVGTMSGAILDHFISLGLFGLGG